MLEKIKLLEKKGASLHPDTHQRTRDWNRIYAFADRFLEELKDGKAYKIPNSLSGRLELSVDNPLGLEEILSELQTDMVDNGLNPASGGHLGYIPGGGIHTGTLGDYLAAVTNQYAGIGFGGPGAVKIENELIRWMCSLVGFPKGSLGNLTSGGSIANLIAFVTAREAKNIHSKDYANQCFYLTEQVHHCVHKAIRICGMADSRTRFIEVDENFRMKPEALEKQILKDLADGLNPFMLIASVGTTDTGAVDPLQAIAAIVKKHNIWFHVDAAYGGFFILSKLENEDGSLVKDLFKGIELADSVAIDPHKGLFLSYGLGAVLIKDVASLYKAHYYKAAYMQDTLSDQEELSPCDLSPELTKHFRGLRMWLPLKLYGIEPFRALLDEKILLCRYFYNEIQKMGFEVGPYPELSVCIYRFVPDSGEANHFNELLHGEMLSNGRIFISTTTIHGVYWFRLAVLNFRTHLKEIELLLDMFRKALPKVLNSWKAV